MDTFVRVKLENGAEATLTEDQAKAHKLEVLDKPATDARGYALSDKPKANLTPAGSRYDAMSADEVTAEAAERGITAEGTGKDGNVLKADLVAALVAADAA